MRKRNLALILCIAVMACGCGQSAKSQDMEVTTQEPDAKVVEEVPSWESENIEDRVIEPEPEQQEPEGDEQYAIYERFLDGEEPLYFPQRLNGYQEFGDAMIEEGSSYSLDEICNRMNRYNNYKRAVSEMEQLSYAYIDCGADGEVELALLFNDLSYWSSEYDVISMVLIIKNIGGRLEMCRVVDTSGWWGFCNEYGVLTQGHSINMFSEYEVVSYLDADGNDVEVYHKITEDWGYDMLYEYGDNSEIYDIAKVYDLDYTFVINSYSFKPFDSYPNYEDYAADLKYSFELRDTDSGEEILAEDADPSAYVNSDYLELLDRAGITFYSAEEIDAMILEKAKTAGLTEEMLNGKPIQWTALEEKDYDLIYGVEKEEGVSDMERAMEAYRRFLSDRGHFKEILSYPIGEIELSYGMVDGFFIKDMNGDDIPELLIEMAEPYYGFQDLFIYVFDPDSGRVKLDQTIDALGCVVDNSVYPNGIDGWLLYEMRTNEPILFGYNSVNQLIWFDEAVDVDDSITVYWCDYPGYGSKLTAHYYYEYIEYEDIDSLYGEIKINTWELEGIHESREEAEKALKGYKPFIFYDVTPENIDKYVNVNYLDAGMENYDKEDVIMDKEAFAKLYNNVMDMDNEYMIPREGPFETDDEHIAFREYNLDYLIQLYDRLFGRW